MSSAKVRSFINRHKVLAPAVLLAVLGALTLFNSRNRIRRLFQPERKVVFDYERFPVYGEDHAYQTFQVAHPVGKKRMRFEVPVREGETIEVGLIRTADTSSYYAPFSGKIRFRVYREKWPRNEILLESVRKVAVGERVSFEIDGARLGGGDTPREITVEVDKEERGEAKGYEPYRDFAFLVPSVRNKRRPGEFNVILVSFDTLRADHLGCYGYERDTSPNVDKFAQQGILFTQAISPSCWTIPAHYSLFTSLYPSAHQNNDYPTVHQNDGWSEYYHFLYSHKTLAGALRKNGYYTIGITNGGYVSSEFGFGNGFNMYKEYLSIMEILSPERQWTYEYDSKKIFGEATKWLEENGDTKFFMFLHTFECHIPYEHTFFVSEKVTDSLIEHRKALYDGDIRYADSCFGELMEKLRSLGLMSNTIIIFLSDHGEDFYDHYREADIIPPYTKQIIPQLSDVDHAHSLYDELVHVPLIFYVPGLEAKKKTVENQVRLIDIMPTILDILNVTYDGPVQGTSLLELMRTGERDEDPPAISESTVVGPERRSIRKDGYKYIWIEKPNEIHMYTFRGIRRHELFDLRKDPGEKHDICGENRELAEKYHGMLEEQLQESLSIGKALRQNYEPVEHTKKEIDGELIDNLRALGYMN